MHPKEYTKDYTTNKYTEEFFRMPVLMLMLITLLNDGTLITVGYDNAIPSQRPDKWNLKVVWLVSVVLGLVACVSSLILLHVVLDSNNPGGVLQKMGIPAVPYPKVSAGARRHVVVH
jgi:H+-transporting ATPase